MLQATQCDVLRSTRTKRSSRPSSARQSGLRSPEIVTRSRFQDSLEIAVFEGFPREDGAADGRPERRHRARSQAFRALAAPRPPARVIGNLPKRWVELVDARSSPGGGRVLPAW